MRWTSTSGWQFARSLSDAVRALTRQYGPLVPIPKAASSSGAERALPFSVTAEAAAVWCTAALEAGWATGHACTLKLGDRKIVLYEGGAHLHELTPTRPSLQTAYETTELLSHWATALREFQIAQQTTPEPSATTSSDS
jgi:hypothetical protein